MVTGGRCGEVNGVAVTARSMVDEVHQVLNVRVVGATNDEGSAPKIRQIFANSINCISRLLIQPCRVKAGELRGDRQCRNAVRCVGRRHEFGQIEQRLDFFRW